jgi:hypothetical protein
MTTEILSDYARHNVGWLREALAKRLDGFSRDEGEAFAYLCSRIAGLFAELQEQIQGRLAVGMESRPLLALANAFHPLAPEAIGQFAAIRERVAAVPELKAVLPLLDVAIAGMERVRAFFASLVTQIRTSGPPVDLDKLRVLEAGPFIRLEH